MRDIDQTRLSSNLYAAITLVLVAISIQTLDAQTTELPFTNPAAMFEELFRESTAEESEALEKVDIPIAVERKFGDEILRAGLSSLNEAGVQVKTDGRDVEYVQSLVEIVKPNMKNAARYPTVAVLIVKSPRVDARSIPGGTLVFYEGLLDKAGSEAALVGIVGHELSHLDHGHQLMPLKRQKLAETANGQLVHGMTSIPSVQFMTRVWSRPFRPEDEREADRDGVAWCFAAGYDPKEMAKLFQSKEGEQTARVETPWSSLFQTHPCDHERRLAILRQVSQLHKGKSKTKDLFIGRENLLQRISRSQQFALQKK